MCDKHTSFPSKNDLIIKTNIYTKLNLSTEKNYMEVQILKEGTLKKVSRISEGTYGIVYEGCSSEGLSVAVKRIKVDKNTNFVACVKELDLLARTKGNPFIINLLAVSKGSPFYPTGSDSPLRGDNAIYFDDRIYLIFEKAAYNALGLIDGKTSLSYIKMVMLQTLLGLEYLHGHNIIHRDIKPHNLLWCRDKEYRIIKFCDFGLSKIYTKQETNSCYVASPVYRAPELFFHMNDYDYTSDIWSLGCVFYELITHKPFIDPDVYGEDESTGPQKVLNHILYRIPELPSIDFLNKAQKTLDTVINKRYISRKRPHTWDTLLNKDQNYINNFNNTEVNSTYNNFKDLLTNMMKINPKERFTAARALDHIFFKDYTSNIKNVRSMFPPVDLNYNNPKIKIIKCDERSWAMGIVYYYYDRQLVTDPISGKRLYPWYQNRILFQAIDIYDRFLCYYYEKKMYNDKKLNKEGAELCFTICLYLSIKYFVTLLDKCSFNELVNEQYGTPDMKKLAEDYEWFILSDVLSFKIYRPTVYETADNFDIKLDPQQTVNLLYVYAGLSEENCEITQLFVRCAKDAMIPIDSKKFIVPILGIQNGQELGFQLKENISKNIPKIYVPTDDFNINKYKYVNDESNQHINLGLQTTHGNNLSISQNIDNFIHPETVKIM
jgi:serine/threonine protein kinase